MCSVEKSSFPGSCPPRRAMEAIQVNITGLVREVRTPVPSACQPSEGRGEEETESGTEISPKEDRKEFQCCGNQEEGGLQKQRAHWEVRSVLGSLTQLVREIPTAAGAGNRVWLKRK